MTKRPVIRQFHFIFAATVVCSAVVAGPVQFTVNPAQSQVKLAGSVIGFPLQEQGPGSLTTSFEGVLAVLVDEDSIQFTAPGLLTARTNGVWRPGPGGASGSAPADVAAKATTPLGSVVGALRNVMLTVTSGVLQLTNGQFSAADLILAFPEDSPSSFDYDAGFLLGSDGLPLSGIATNRLVNVATVTGEPGARTLTIEVDTEFKFSAITPNDSAVQFTGRLVATETPVLTITSIAVINQVVTLRLQGAGGNPRLESSANLRQWTTEAPTRSTEAAEIVLTLPVNGAERFYRVANE